MEQTKIDLLIQESESYAEKWNDLENQFKLSSCFIAGAKWQQQETIEEVFEWLNTNNYVTDLKETMIEDFNKFKKK